MEFEFIYDPVPLIIIRNIFTKKENSEIFAEAIKNKKNFKLGIAIDKNKKFRTNLMIDYDIIYNKDRTKSKLLNLIDKNFKNMKFKEILNSFVFPINLLGQTNFHESQVSRYGNQGQEYKYHQDSFAENNSRMITLVYTKEEKYNLQDRQYLMVRYLIKTKHR